MLDLSINQPIVEIIAVVGRKSISFPKGYRPTQSLMM